MVTPRLYSFPSLPTPPVIRVPPLTLARWPPEGASNHYGHPANISGPSLGTKPLRSAGVPDMRGVLAVDERDNTASQRQLTHIGQGSHRMDESVSICHLFDWEWSSVSCRFMSCHCLLAIATQQSRRCPYSSCSFPHGGIILHCLLFLATFTHTSIDVPTSFLPLSLGFVQSRPSSEPPLRKEP